MTRENFIFKSVSINFVKSFFILYVLFSGLSFSYAAPTDEPCTPTGYSDPLGNISGSSDCLTDTTGATANNAASQAAVAAKNEECGGEDNFNCYTLLEGFGSEDDKLTTVTIKATGLGEYLELIMTYLLMIVTIAAVFFMIYGGILYLTSDIVTKKAEGREVITRVVIGLIFVFSVWTIMNSINSGLLKNSLNFSLESIGAAVKSAVTGVPAPTTPSPLPSGTAPVPTSPPASALRSCPEGLEIVSGSFQLCKTVAQNMRNLIEAAKADGIILGLASAYRSSDSGLVSGGTVAASGKSMHQQGLSVDFNGGFKYGPATDKRFVWLVNNASKYGFYNTLYSTKKDEYNHWSTSGR